MYIWLCRKVKKLPLPWYICLTADWVDYIEDSWVKGQKRMFENCRGSTHLRLVEDLAHESLHAAYEVSGPMNHDVDEQMVCNTADNESLGGQAAREKVIKRVVQDVYNHDICSRKMKVQQQLKELAEAHANKLIKGDLVEAFRATYTSEEHDLLQVQRDFGLD